MAQQVKIYDEDPCGRGFDSWSCSVGGGADVAEAVVQLQLQRPFDPRPGNVPVPPSGALKRRGRKTTRCVRVFGRTVLSGLMSCFRLRNTRGHTEK